jgi:hypothetical protein
MIIKLAMVSDVYMSENADDITCKVVFRKEEKIIEDIIIMAILDD